MARNRTLGIIEPNLIVLAGLKQIFSESGFEVVLESESLTELWKFSPPAPKIDALLIDVEQDAYPTEAEIARLRAEFPDCRIVLMANSSEHANVAHALRHGLDGLILKTCCIEALAKTLELAVLGERVFPADALRPLSILKDDLASCRQIDDNVVYNLSTREIEVLKCLSKGRANKEIARDLGISEATVKVHVKAILRKSHARNRTEAALWATSVGIGEERRSEQERQIRSLP